MNKAVFLSSTSFPAKSTCWAEVWFVLADPNHERPIECKRRLAPSTVFQATDFRISANTLWRLLTKADRSLVAVDNCIARCLEWYRTYNAGSRCSILPLETEHEEEVCRIPSGSRELCVCTNRWTKFLIVYEIRKPFVVWTELIEFCNGGNGHGRCRAGEQIEQKRRA